MAKKNEEATAPRMSQIERLQQQLAEAQAKAEAREQKKIEVLKQQFEAAVIRQNKAEAKVNGTIIAETELTAMIVKATK